MRLRKLDIHFFLKSIQQKGFFHLLSANVLIQVFAFASQLFVAGILSPEDIGRIKIIQTYLSIFSVIAGMGFNSSTLKICSEGRSHHENSNYLNASIIFSIISTTIVYLIVLILNSFELFSSDTLIKLLIPIGLFPLISNTLFVLFIGYFQAMKEIKLFSNLTVINKLLSIIGVIIFAYYWGIKGYYIAYNLSFLLMILATAVIIKKKIRFTFKIRFKEMFQFHWKYARSSMFSNIVAELSAYIDIILIGLLINDMHEIGLYSFALTITIILRLFPSTVQQITIPYFSSFKECKDDFIHLFKKYNRLLYVIVVVSLLTLLICAPPALHFIFDGKYDKSYPYLIFLSIGWSIRNLNQLQSSAIFGLGKIHYNAYIGLITLLTNIVIYTLAIHQFGIMGAAYASISSGIIFWIASRYFFNKAIKKTIWEV